MGRENIFGAVAPVYDRLNDLLSAGRHREWKRRLVRDLLGSGEARRGPVLDVATGTGDVAAGLLRAGAGPVLGLDPCRGMIREGVRRGRRCDGFMAGEAEALPVSERSLGGIACAFGVRNFSDRKAAFREWARVIRPGGYASVLEIFPPRASGSPAWIRAAWRFGVPMAGSLFGRGKGYRYLKDSVEAFLSPDALRAEIEGAGFRFRREEVLGPGGMVRLLGMKRNG